MQITDNKLPSQEQIIFGLLLTFVGGFFDSYTFINSHGIFANAQTGNLIFFGIELANQNYYSALSYIPPVSFFVLGVLFNEYILHKFKIVSKKYYINLSLLFQIMILTLCYLFPNILNVDVRPLLISFVCAMQFDSFRTVNKIPFASIFCTGNLRSASEYIFRHFYLKEKNSKSKIYIYTSLIVVFLLGVIIGGQLSNYFNHHAILVAIVVLIINFIIAYVHDKKREI